MSGINSGYLCIFSEKNIYLMQLSFFYRKDFSKKRSFQSFFYLNFETFFSCKYKLFAINLIQKYAIIKFHSFDIQNRKLYKEFIYK